MEAAISISPIEHRPKSGVKGGIALAVSRLFLTSAACLALTSLNAWGQAASPEQRAAPSTVAAAYALPETESWELKGEDGYSYQIFVSMPKGDPPPDGYPLLYVLDGNAMFAGFAEARRIQAFALSDVGKSIVVGIGYKTDMAYDTTRRLYDFTPDFQKPVMPAQKRLAHLKAGGRDVFARFILERLRPELARRYAVNSDRQALFGHSLGGLFSLYMLYSHPTAFHAIIAASPTIWWNDQAIVAEERIFAAKLTAGKVPGRISRVRVVTGELEEAAVSKTDAEALAKRLELLSGYGLRSEFELFRGETHITVPSRSTTSTLRFAFGWP